MSLVHPINTSVCLEKLCESNFQKLFYLIPNLCSFEHYATGETENKPSLYVTIIDRTQHTLTIELSHHFNQLPEKLIEPAVKIRVYLDANLAEVIRDHARPSVSTIYKDPAQSIEIMDYKWRLNYFLQKWLDHCLQTQYHFKMTETA